MRTIRNWITDRLITLLFRLLGNSKARGYNVSYLFGATTNSHEQRKHRWQNALHRIWRDKDFLDWLYYQSESDKENVFRGKVSAALSKGARIRTLFIVYSARMAYLESLKTKRSNATERSDADDEIKHVKQSYSKIVDVKDDLL